MQFTEIDKVRDKLFLDWRHNKFLNEVNLNLLIQLIKTLLELTNGSNT